MVIYKLKQVFLAVQCPSVLMEASRKSKEEFKQDVQRNEASAIKEEDLLKLKTKAQTELVGQAVNGGVMDLLKLAKSSLEWRL